MEQQTLELLRALQSSERNSGAFTHIRALLPTERTRLAAAEDRATLADISELLEVWADSAPKELAAAAAAEAAQIADEDLEQAERAAQLYMLSLERSPGELAALSKLDALLCRRGEYDRLEAALAMQAQALSALPEASPAAIAGIFRRLGQLRTERGKDLGSAIDAYERALDLAVDMDIVRELADLYGKRRATGDVEQAADLYCMLAEVLGAEEGILLLERALDQAPGHDAALDLLESFVPAAEHPGKLKARWAAYIQRSDNEAGANGRRALLAQAHAGVGEYREAIVCLGPLIERGDPDALRMQAAYLASMQEKTPREAGRDKPHAKAGNGSIARPATLVGFRMPTPAAPPRDAQPSGQGAGGERAKGTGDTRPLRVKPARSGETLVGFQLPRNDADGASKPATKSGKAEPAAKAAKKSEAEPRPSEVASKAISPKPADKPKASSTVPTARARANSSSPPQSQPPTLAAAAAKAAALKAGRSPAPAASGPAAISASAPAVRSSIPRVATAAASSLLAATPQVTKPAAGPRIAPVSAAVAPVSRPAPVAAFSAPVPAIGAPPASMHVPASDRRNLLIGGGIAVLLIGGVVTFALGSGSKKPPTALVTRGEAVAPRPSAEPVAAPAPPAVAAPTAVAAVPEPAPTAVPSAPAKQAAAPEAAPAASKKHASPFGHLVPGKAHVTGGGLSSGQVALVLEDSLPPIEQCYTTALEKKPRMQGRVVFGWTIEKTGKPSRVRKLSGSLSEDSLLDCSFDAIRKVRFPKPKKKTSDITWPLDYKKG